MANKAISELPQAQNVNNQDLFVLEQSGIAKKLPAETFITEQGIINALAEALDGHGGISSVTLASVSGRIRTYRITFTDQSATTFQVYDGTSIDRISRTSSSGLDDVYTIFLSDGTTTFFTVHNGADGTVSEAMLNDALKDKAPAITETTESSAIATFSDGADDMVMHHVIAEINPVQDLSNGDPSPTNICPISGHTEVNVTRTGKNLGEFTNGKGIDANGNIHDIANRSATLTPIKIAEGKQYKWYNSAGHSCIYTVWNGDTLIRRLAGIANGSILNTADGKELYVCGYADASTNVLPETCGVFLADEFDGFEPYTGNQISLSWQTEAGTVYGGTVDVATGLLTVEWAKYIITADILSETIVKEGNLWRVVLNRSLYGDNNDYKMGLCDRYTFRTGYVMANTYNNSIAFNYYSGTQILIRDDSITTADELRASISNQSIECVYPIATPQTYQLTPQEVIKTLLGTNNVWTDLSNVTVKYPADTKLYIEKLTQPTEDDLVANQAITSGKYFMIGNSLYLALANIASGAQITIGTNAQRVSLADALNTINS